MNRKLNILRHAKSSWKNSFIADIDRPLKNRGINDSKLIAEAINKCGIKPDLIVSSPAMRAIQTAVLFARELNYEINNIQVKNSVYGGSGNTILDIIHKTNNNISELMIIGHNPVFTEITNIFSDKYIENLPTTGVIHLEFETEHWSDIGNGNITRQRLFTPKDLKNEE